MIIKGIPAKSEKRTPDTEETINVSGIPILFSVFSAKRPPKAMAPDKQAKKINEAAANDFEFKPSLKSERKCGKANILESSSIKLYPYLMANLFTCQRIAWQCTNLTVLKIPLRLLF